MSFSRAAHDPSVAGDGDTSPTELGRNMRSDDAPHAASMKLSKTFLEPAFSNSMSSLLPSTATMRP